MLLRPYSVFSQLRDTTRKTFEQWVPAELGTWHEQSFTWSGRWSDGEHIIECEVLFRALDRPQDVKKLLSLELTGAYINEVREIPKHVLDVLQTRVGRFPSRAQGGATWFGIWADTNPWHANGHMAAHPSAPARPLGIVYFAARAVSNRGGNRSRSLTSSILFAGRALSRPRRGPQPASP